MPQLGSNQLGTQQLGQSRPRTTATDIVQVVVDLLDGFSGWSLTAPEVYRHEEVPQSDKEAKPDSAIYVWSPVDASLDKFSADGDVLDEMRTVEAQIWDLDHSDAETYHQDVIDFLNDYSNDNEASTPFHFLQPISATDSRSDKIARMTDHYILSVQINAHRHRDT